MPILFYQCCILSLKIVFKCEKIYIYFKVEQFLMIINHFLLFGKLSMFLLEYGDLILIQIIFFNIKDILTFSLILEI